MCMIPRNVNINTKISLHGDLVIFEKQCIIITVKCYLFSWGFPNDRSLSGHVKLKISKFTLVAMELLVTATKAEFPPLHSFLNVITYCKISRKWISQNITGQHKGLHILTLPGLQYIRYGNVFECGEGHFYCIYLHL